MVGKKKVSVTLSLSSDLVSQLRKEARETGLSLSDLVELKLKRYRVVKDEGRVSV